MMIAAIAGLLASLMSVAPSAAAPEWTPVGADLYLSYEPGDAAPYGPPANGEHGVSMSDDGTRLAVGNPAADTVGVFEWDGSSWTQTDTLTGPVGSFGLAIEMSGDGERLAVGAPHWSSNTGYTRVYQRAGDGSWSQIGSDIQGVNGYNVPGDPGDFTGWSVGLSDDGSVLVVGDAQWDDDPLDNKGRARVYAWSGSAWVQRGLDIIGSEADGISGRTVAINDAGDIIASGAWQSGASDNGRVQVFEWNGSAWTQVGADLDGVNNAEFGRTVDLDSDGHRLAVGAPGTSGGDGAVHVYDWSGTSWDLAGSSISGDTGDAFGWGLAVSKDGNTLIAGSPTHDNGADVDSGQTRVYTWSGSAWVQRHTALFGEAEDELGWSVDVTDSGRIAINAPFNDTDASDGGRIQVFDFFDLPGAPTAVDTSFTDDVVTVSWTSPADTGGTPITSYTATASPGGATCTVASTSCEFGGLTFGTDYTFSVIATNSYGDSPAGQTVMDDFLGVPGAPTAVETTSTATGVTVSWTAPAETGGTAITGYTATASPGDTTCTTTTTSCVFEDLSYGTDYTFSVVASNAFGDGSAPPETAAVESITLLTEAEVGVDCDATNEHPFNDVVGGSIFEAAIACLYGLEVTFGRTADTYDPAAPVSREEMAAFMARLAESLTGVGRGGCSAEHPFEDVPLTSFAYDAVGCIYELKVTFGRTADTYDPAASVSRQEMAAFITRLYEVLANLT